MSGASVTQTVLQSSRWGETCGVIKTAMPIVAGMLASTATDIITQIYMAHLGPDELTANQWVMTYKLSQTALSAPMNALYGLMGEKLGAIHAAQAEKDKKTAREAVFRMGRQGLYYAFVSAAITVAAFYFSGFALENIFHENKLITSMTQKFLRWYLVSVPAFAYGAVVRPYLNLFNQRGWVTALNLSSVPLVWFFSYGLSMGKMGLPELGLEGLAIAGAVRIWFNAIAFSLLIAFKKTPPVLKVSGKDLNVGEIKLSGLFRFKLEDAKSRKLRSEFLKFPFSKFESRDFSALQDFLRESQQDLKTKSLKSIFSEIMEQEVDSESPVNPVNMGVSSIHVDVQEGNNVLPIADFKTLMLSSSEVDELRQFLISKEREDLSYKLPPGSMMKEFLCTGLPLIGRLGVEWSSAFFGTGFYSWINKDAVTVASAVSTVSNLVFTVTQSFGNAGVQLIGTMVGAKDFSAAYRLGNISMMLSLIWAVAWCGITPFIANPVAQLFLGAEALSSPFVHDWLLPIMSLVVVGQVFDGLRYGAASAYQGLTKVTLNPMFASLFGMGLVGLLLSYELGVKVMHSPYGVAIGGIVGNAVAGSLCLALWFRANYQSTDLPQESKPCTRIAACFNRRHRLQSFGNGGQYGGVGVVPQEQHRAASGVLSGSTTFRTPSGDEYFELQDGTNIEEGLGIPPDRRSSTPVPAPVSPVSASGVYPSVL